MRLIMSYLLLRLLVPLLLSTAAYSSDLLSYLSQFHPKEVSSIGLICEKLAELGYHDLYEDDDSITILTNITYTLEPTDKHPKQQTLGELDIILLKDGVVSEVAEVKCSNHKRVNAALQKAKEQLKRFHKMCVVNECALWKGKKRVKLQYPQDSDDIVYKRISYQGSSPRFTQFSVTYNEIVTLHAMLNLKSRKRH